MKLSSIPIGLIALCAAAFISISPAHAQQDSALLDALVKKGVLSDREAEDIRAQDQKDYNMTAASKISLASSIKSITFYGDLRLRYELRDGTTPAGATGSGGAFSTTGDGQDRNAWRYRLRFGVKGELTDHFFFGIRAATNPNYDRSGNVTFGHSDAAGPFGKDQSLLALDQVYLGWHANDDFTLTGGQMPQPLYTTSMIWSDDLNPTGAAEQYDHTFGDVEVFATAGQFVYQAAAGNGITNGLGANTGFANTFMYAEQAGFKYKINADMSFKAAATFYTYSGTKSNNVTTVSGLYSDTPLNISNASLSTSSGAAANVATAAENNSPSYFNGPFVGAASAPTTNVSGINDLAVLEIPMEFDFKAGKVPMRIFSDFAYNTQAGERADQARDAILSAEETGVSNTGVTAVASTSAGATTTITMGGISNTFNGTPAQVDTLLGNTVATAPPAGTTVKTTAASGHSAIVNTSTMVANSPTFQGVLNSGKGFLDQTAFQFGIEAGQMKKKGDWDGKLFYQSTGYYAVDPNLIDADIFNAATNMQGVVVSVSHNWTDGLSSTLRYAYATQVNDQMATPNVNQDLTLGTIHEYNLFQADVMWKF